MSDWWNVGRDVMDVYRFFQFSFQDFIFVQRHSYESVSIDSMTF